jgi:hypothetical protein
MSYLVIESEWMSDEFTRSKLNAIKTRFYNEVGTKIDAGYSTSGGIQVITNKFDDESWKYKWLQAVSRQTKV